jgi:hypothetical protein
MHWMFICMGLRQAPLASTVDGIGLILRLGTGITNPAVYVAILCLGTAVVCTMVSFVGRQLALNQEEEKRRILTLTWQLRQLLPSPSVQLPRLSLRPDSYAPGERASEKQPRFRRQR